MSGRFICLLLNELTFQGKYMIVVAYCEAIVWGVVYLDHLLCLSFLKNRDVKSVPLVSI